MAIQTYFTLNTSIKIPAIAKPLKIENTIEVTLKQGHRHINYTTIYRNKTEVGTSVKKSGNTKHTPTDILPALEKTLKDLEFPLNEDSIFELEDINYINTFKKIKKFLAIRKVKAIGISNFNIRHLDNPLNKIDIVPTTNQIEAHPYLQQPELGDIIEVYSPLGNNQTRVPRTVDNPVVAEVAKEIGIDPGPLLASWGIQHSTSVTPSRIAANLQVKTLPDNIYGKLTGLERHKRFSFPANWGYNIFEEVGDKTVRKVAIAAGPVNKIKFTVPFKAYCTYVKTSL
ncbi:hypothetical protein N7478_003929 [Penicillium angulare]|uniref:uncharacterized protein n=1 Tax=Penicillium angulare TaxID=116970 RepID=UPI00253FAE1B|nr:uncharacterized protein N7478_003929 [Penicillium angulare]KAJ5288243.1 hypothetical protein N7478_003929 [Penicillium angulare]